MDIVFFIIIGIIIGSTFYTYDNKSGKNLYKRWYDLSNKNKLNPKLDKGFVVNQLFGQKLSISITIGIIFYVLGFFIGMDAFYGIFYSIGIMIGVLLAFYLAPKLLGLFSKTASETIEYIEEIEKGNKKVTDEITNLVKKKETPEANIKTEPSTNEEPKTETKKDDNWRDGVNKFLDK